MPARQPLPRLWLMTDERIGDRLLPALANLPQGGGIVFRHYSLEEQKRRVLFEQVKAIARSRHQLLLLAGPADLAAQWGADGSHGPGRGLGLRSASAHDLGEILAANRAGADLIFLAPVFATRSHPGAHTLGPAHFNRRGRRTDLPVIALGGMNAIRARRLREAYGWAGIDAWL
jgi:thiamine-phosphate pyrophosphorylase